VCVVCVCVFNTGEVHHWCVALTNEGIAMDYLHDDLREMFGLDPETDLDRAARGLAESLTRHHMAMFALWNYHTQRSGR
jgi:hypothetical protein